MTAVLGYPKGDVWILFEDLIVYSLGRAYWVIVRVEIKGRNSYLGNELVTA